MGNADEAITCSRQVAGLETMSEGGILLNGRELFGPGLDRMVVFQNVSLIPWMTV